MTTLEMSLAALMGVYDQYAGSDGKLSKPEARKLMEKELPVLLQGAKDPGTVDQLLNGLDMDGDGSFDFFEFSVFFCTLACACHGLPTSK